jgi:hypothetical protein
MYSTLWKAAAPALPEVTDARERVARFDPGLNGFDIYSSDM